jgi:integrase
MFLSKYTNGIFYLYYKDSKGLRCKVSTRTKNKSEALEFLRNHKLPQDATKNLRSVITLKQFKEEYLAFVKVNAAERTHRLHELALRRLVELLGENVFLHTITPRDIEKLKIQLAETLDPNTVNIRLKKLKRAFNVALDWELLEKNPFEKISFIKVAHKALQYLPPEDFEKLVSVITEDQFKDIVMFAVCTGCRRAEITNLKWENVNLTMKFITIQSDKNFQVKAGRLRALPISPFLMSVLDRRFLKRKGAYVFHNHGYKLSDDWLTHRFTQYKIKAKLKDEYHFHSLRSTFASWLVMNQQDIYSVSKLLGHSKVTTTEQYYAHLQTDRLFSTMLVIDNVIGKALEDKEQEPQICTLERHTSKNHQK